MLSNSRGKSSNNKVVNNLRVPTRSTDGSPTRDVETGAMVWCSSGENGTVVAEYEDGLTVTRHADGTVQRWRRGDGEESAATSLVLVECAGFASVEVRNRGGWGVGEKAFNAAGGWCSC